MHLCKKIRNIINSDRSISMYTRNTLMYIGDSRNHITVQIEIYVRARIRIYKHDPKLDLKLKNIWKH